MNYRDVLEATRGRENRSRCDEEDVLGAGRDRRCDRDDDVLGVSRDRKRDRDDDVLGVSRDRKRDRDDDVLGVSRNVCPQKKGTVLRIFIPAGAEINLLDIIEIASPGGICIIVRLPFLENLCGKSDLAGVFDSIKRAGGRVDVLDY